ncbi:hypothetical protein NQ315_002194 [Exocentrus adspersus]|uniref:Uncharacterized protein n=1 Tax=Exocentrus adspersus TaxID=1586481 RepID=A0AAV8W005_9CUCU|nr:hypothetical protein NQ315_002194 [Exocentrus adspersus]
MFHVIHFCFLLAFAFNLCQCFEEAWRAYQNDLRHANREELYVKNVSTDETFKLDASVKKWISLTVGPTCYSIGLMDKALAVLEATPKLNQTGFQIKHKIQEFSKTPVDAILVESKTREEIDVVLVVAFKNDLTLEWYRVIGTDLENFWSWELPRPVVHINAFSVGTKRVLLYATDQYGHSIHVSDPVSSSAFNSHEFDSYLSLPQKSLGVVTIFKYQENRFVPYTTIRSLNVDTVVSFEIGFESFLAIDGTGVGIYQFKRDGLEKQDIAHSNHDGIGAWLPVPVRMYRDDVVIFAQRHLNHTTHSSYVIEVITYNGAKFEEHEDVACTHFGEVVESLNCLSEGNGITGSSYLAVGDEFGLIVPRGSNFSIIFMVRFSMKQIPNPLEAEIKELFRQKEMLQKKIQEQGQEFEEFRSAYKASQAIGHGDDIILSQQQQQRASEAPSIDKQLLEVVTAQVEDVKERTDKVIERLNKLEFDVVTINGTVTIQGEGIFKQVEVDKIAGEAATALLEDIVRYWVVFNEFARQLQKDSIGKITGDKILNKLDVHHVIFVKVNGVAAGEILFRNGSQVELEGNVTFYSDVELENINVLTGEVNGVHLIDEVVDMTREYNGTLSFTNVQVQGRFEAETVNGKQLLQSGEANVSNADEDLVQELDAVFVPKNLTVGKINGDDFDDFIKQICLTNVMCVIPHTLKINGDVIADDASVTFLNGLKFPEEYVFKKSGTQTVITGRKTFRNLEVYDVVSNGTVDGVNTKELITLSTNQHIPGSVTFKDIEVAEQLEVDGQILGTGIEQFLPNPTLQQVANISAKVTFKRLEVDGNVIIEDSFNGSSFADLLKNLLYKDQQAEISAEKQFPQGLTVRGNLEVTSNSINNLDVETIITKDTEQVLNITKLNGKVTIDNLNIDGKFNKVNVNEMEQELVKLTGEQSISSTLIFKEELEVENIEITEALNNVKPDDYLYSDTELETAFGFKEIEADTITVEGNFSGSITNFDIKEFSTQYLSRSKDQVIEAHYDIVKSIVDNLNTESINGENVTDVLNYEEFSAKVLEALNSGQIKVKDLYVNGSLQVESINGVTGNDWLPSESLKGPDGKYKKQLIIEGEVYFNTLDMEKLSSVDWKLLNNQTVRKDELNLTISAASKNFLEGINVAKLIETKKVNGIPIGNVLRKQGRQTVKGPVVIEGDVFFKENVNVTENLDEVGVGEILTHLKVENGIYRFKGDMLFLRQPHIYNLTIQGYANDKNISKHFTNLVYLDKDATFYENTVFEAPVEISGNLAVEQDINGINFADKAGQIVLTTQDAEIEGTVTFTRPVILTESLTVHGDLTTKTLFGVDLEEWKSNSVFLDKGKVDGTFEFDNVFVKGDVTIDRLNEIDMKTVIPLKTNQNLDRLEFGDVTATKDVTVFELVNGYKNLSDEYAVTVMLDEDQQIGSDVVFNNTILVRDQMHVDFIDGKPASKIVTTSTDQNLTSAFDFKSKCRMNSDLRVRGFVDGVNITACKKKNVQTSSRDTQYIFDSWSIDGDLIFNDAVQGGGLINDLNLTDVLEKVVARQKYKYNTEKAIIEDYKQMCVDVSYMYEAVKKQIYKFMYFEQLQTITFKNPVQFVYYFQFGNNNYLLVNEEACTSQLLIFKGTAFEHFAIVETGRIEQAVSVVGDTDGMFLVTRGTGECATEGTNVWRFDSEAVEVYYKIEDQDLLQESVVPFTFYGLSQQGVVEFKITYNNPTQYRKWNVSEDNVAFMPRGLKTGPCLRTGRKVIFLDSKNSPVDEYNADTQYTAIENTREVANRFVPGRSGGDLVVTRVGIKSAQRKFLAVATHEETSVKGRLDFVKIYSDVLEGELFHKVPAYKPSSLLSIEFDQGETLLAFLENEKVLQIYEYKGIEGFKYRSSAKVDGSKLFLMTLQIKPYLNPRKAIGIINNNQINIVQAVMVGNKIRNDLKCGLENL